MAFPVSLKATHLGLCQICVKRAAKTSQIDTILHERTPEKLFKNNELIFQVVVDSTSRAVGSSEKSAG